MEEQLEARPTLMFRKKSFRRKNKTVVLFNEEDRKEYLTGFQKRKTFRRKKAVEEMHLKIKQQRKDMKKEMHSLTKRSDRYHFQSNTNANCANEGLEMREMQSSNDTIFELPEHIVTVSEVDHRNQLNECIHLNDNEPKAVPGSDKAIKLLARKLGQMHNTQRRGIKVMKQKHHAGHRLKSKQNIAICRGKAVRHRHK